MKTRSLGSLLSRRAKLMAEIAAIDEEIERRRAELLEATGLSKPRARDTVIKMFSNTARVNMSSAKANGDPLTAAANAAGYSLRRLADEVERRLAKRGITCSQSLISQARAGKRSIRQPVVDTIQKLIDFPATAENWPGGIADK